MSRQVLEPDDYTFLDYRRMTFSLGVVAEGHVWLAGSTAVLFDPATKAMVVQGDLVAQASTINRKMACVLKAAKLDFSHVERVVQYITPAAVADLAKLDALQAANFPGATIATIVVDRLLRSEALIEIEAIAAPHATGDVVYLPSVLEADGAKAWARGEALLSERGLSTANLLRTFELRTEGDATARPGSVCRGWMPRLARSPAGVQLEMTAVRGAAQGRIVSVAIEGDPAAGDVAEQCRAVYRKLADVLAGMGASLDTVVKTTEFVTPEGLPLYRNTAAVRRELFSAPYPAATGVLASRLGRPGALLSVEATAIARAG